MRQGLLVDIVTGKHFVTGKQAPSHDSCYWETGLPVTKFPSASQSRYEVEKEATTVKTLAEADTATQEAELLRKFGSAERYANLEKTYGDANVSKAMVPKLAADTGLSWRSVEKMAIDMDMTAAQIVQIAKQGRLTDEQIRQANTVNDLLRLSLPSAYAHAKRGEIERKFYSSKWGEEATRMGLFAGQSGLSQMTNSAKDLGLMMMLRR